MKHHASEIHTGTNDHISQPLAVLLKLPRAWTWVTSGLVPRLSGQGGKALLCLTDMSHINSVEGGGKSVSHVNLEQSSQTLLQQTLSVVQHLQVARQTMTCMPQKLVRHSVALIYIYIYRLETEQEGLPGCAHHGTVPGDLCHPQGCTTQGG